MFIQGTTTEIGEKIPANFIDFVTKNNAKTFFLHLNTLGFFFNFQILFFPLCPKDKTAVKALLQGNGFFQKKILICGCHQSTVINECVKVWTIESRNGNLRKYLFSLYAIQLMLWKCWRSRNQLNTTQKIWDRQEEAGKAMSKNLSSVKTKFCTWALEIYIDWEAMSFFTEHFFPKDRGKKHGLKTLLPILYRWTANGLAFMTHLMSRLLSGVNELISLFIDFNGF